MTKQITENLKTSHIFLRENYVKDYYLYLIINFIIEKSSKFA